MAVLLALRGLVQRVGRADAGHDILALRVGQPLAVETVLAGGRVARERHAGGRRISHVAEHHRLHGDRRAPLVGDALDPAVGNGAPAVPGREDRPDRAPQLLLRVVRELPAKHLRDPRLEARHEILQIGLGKIGVRGAAARLLDLVEHAVELLADPLPLGRLHAGRLLHHHVGIHHDETTVGVIDEPRIVRQLDQAGNGARAEPDVEHGLHHAGHRLAGARADRDQQGPVRIAEAHLHLPLDTGQGRGRFVPQAVGVGVPPRVEVRADLGRDGEAGRHRHAKARHLGQVRPLAPEQILHRGVAIGAPAAKYVDQLLAHRDPPASRRPPGRRLSIRRLAPGARSGAHREKPWPSIGWTTVFSSPRPAGLSE